MTILRRVHTTPIERGEHRLGALALIHRHLQNCYVIGRLPGPGDGQQEHGDGYMAQFTLHAG